MRVGDDPRMDDVRRQVQEGNQAIRSAKDEELLKDDADRFASALLGERRTREQAGESSGGLPGSPDATEEGLSSPFGGDDEGSNPFSSRFLGERGGNDAGKTEGAAESAKSEGDSGAGKAGGRPDSEKTDERTFEKSEGEADVGERFADEDVRKDDAKAADAKDDSAFPSGDALLQSLFGSAPSRPADAPQTAEAPAAARIINETVEAVADRVLVSAPGEGGVQEARIQIRQDVLQDVEVRIARDGESVKVEFVTGSDASASFLNERLGELEGRLRTRLGDGVSVSVNRNDAGGGQENEGRSRNRRDVNEERQD